MASLSSQTEYNHLLNAKGQTQIKTSIKPVPVMDKDYKFSEAVDL